MTAAAAAAAGAAAAHRNAEATLLLSHEVSNVLTAMRYNSRWAVVPAYYVRSPSAIVQGRALGVHWADSGTHESR